MKRVLIIVTVAALVTSGTAQARGGHSRTEGGNDAQTLAQCPPEGDARLADVRTLNLKKRRMAVPAAADIDERVTLPAMTIPGDDSDRWNDSRAAAVEGYVADVIVGGVESVNCHTHDPLYRDTHIELTLDPNGGDESKFVIVEVTPQWRERMRGQGIDWSTPALRRQILGRWVRVTGWLLFDAEHANASENTAEPGANVWRATAWEVHPVTSIQVVDRPR